MTFMSVFLCLLMFMGKTVKVKVRSSLKRTWIWFWKISIEVRQIMHFCCEQTICKLIAFSTTTVHNKANVVITWLLSPTKTSTLEQYQKNNLLSSFKNMTMKMLTNLNWFPWSYESLLRITITLFASVAQWK